MIDREEKPFDSQHYNRDYFEGHLLRYQGPVYQQRIKHLKAFLGDVKGKSVLDLGCGVGFFTDLCRSRGAWVFSIDFSLDALCFCQESYGPHLILTRGDATALPYTDACFDLVLINDIIEHLTPEAGKKMLQETRRVLRPGGHFILDTDNARFIMHLPGLRRLNGYLQRNTEQQKALKEIKKSVQAPSLHVKIYDLSELKRMFLGLGFEIEAYESYPYIAVPLRDTLLNLPLIKNLLKSVKGDVQIFRCRKP